MIATQERTMAKKKAKDEDQPVGDTFQLRLPIEYWTALRVVESRTGRPMSVSGQIALEMYFRALGVPFTPNWPEIA